QSLLLHDGRHRRQAPTEGRLPFRECGLSLGLRALHGGRRFLEKAGIGSGPLEAHLPLAGAIENFWLEEKNRRSPTWKEHLDINAVTFAASVVAEEEPLVFG
ncbi:MAG: hypothetical protein J5I94_22320, partial [Phaeodactylibacter sp.]|nr:hypothetical protein [Phaeodactylibacter sp.]